MKVLVACEFSGIVRDSFIRKGHEAVSCDLIDTEFPGPHIKDDILKHLDDGWDLMIAHPPCTDIAVSGTKYFKQKQVDGRQQKAIGFFIALVNAPIKRIAIENPVGIMSSKYRKPDQIIQPYEYGHLESKKTCLWLKNLPKLQPTKILSLPVCGYWDNQTSEHQNRLMVDGKWIGFNDKRTPILRSITYKGIAEAMADQWGKPNLPFQITII